MNLIANSLAIFSLFFGAGNAVFPILLGITEKSNLMPSFLGLALSAIVIPCLGLVAVLLYKGSLKKFFAPLGKIPSKTIVAIMAALLGPLAVMPRCVIVAHASLETLSLGIPLPLFSFIFCLIAFACLWSKSQVFSLLGKVLSPILLLSLVAVIIASKHNLSMNWSNASFSKGFLVGYNTLDLIAALFFAPSIYELMKGSSSQAGLVFSSILAFILLALTYLGLASAASQSLEAGIAPAALLGELAKISLGTTGAYIACLSVALACLTTVVGLGLSLNSWLFESEKPSLKVERFSSVIILSLCSLFTLLGFEKIMAFLGSILYFLYPFLIIWCLYQLALRKRREKNA